MKKFVLFISVQCIVILGVAQKISGTVYNEKGELLPFSSLTIKGTSNGSTANNQAFYSFNARPGKSTIVCQHIGYEALEKTIDVNEDKELDFILKVQYLNMKEVVINNKGENPAYEIIRQAIKKRNYYNNQVKGFHCELYSKDLIKLRSLPDKVMGQKVPDEDRRSMLLDSSGKGIIYLSEAMSKLNSQDPDKFKMEVMSSRVSGSNGFGFTFPVFVNLYSNNVTVFKQGFNQRGFVSPIADNALRFYKYKILGTFIENGKTINSIKVTPRRKYEPLFSGIINITDDDWRIHSVDLMVTKENQLEVLDTLKITQLHIPVGDDIWRVKNQMLYFNFNKFKIDVIGNFLSVYSDYKINPVFDKKTFDRVVIKYDTGVSNRSKTFWDTSRPVPLEFDEQMDYKIKDSVLQLQNDSASIYNNIDSLKKRQGKVKLLSVFFPGISRIHYSKKGNYRWGILPLVNNINFNTAEGVVCQVVSSFLKEIGPDKTYLRIEPNVRYGFANTHLNAWLNISVSGSETDNDNNTHKISWSFSGGKRVSQYNKDVPILPLSNTLSTLTQGNNFMKTYENVFANILFGKSFDNGLKFSIQTLYEDRFPLFNVTNFTFQKKDVVNITENYPTDRVSIDEIVRHQAFIAYFKISIKPGQRYIQLPNGKIPIGSDYPTISLNYSKGISGLLGSDVDFDRWKFSVLGDKNLNLAGLIKYRFNTGGFLNNKKVYIQDYVHFKGSGLSSASEYVNSFQLISSYSHSTTAKIYFSENIEHHFNGLLTNKIPFLKKLNWNLVMGSNGLYVNDANNYIEAFVGLENIFKVCRLDFVAGFERGKKPVTAFVLGADGLLGAVINSTIKTDSQDYTNRIGF